MKKIFSILLVVFSLNATELPSYHCVDTYEASFIQSKGVVKPKVIKTSGRSKLNIIVEEDKNNKISLNVNGNRLLVTDIKHGYIYAVEFTASAMHTWVLFKNKKDKKTYLTISKTYDFIGTPLTSYSFYGCEQVNNSF
jgi:hypothetical protein